MSMCRGTVSKALLMSMAAMSVLCAGLEWLRPSSVVCVMFVRRDVVECWGLKPCCAGDNGMCCVMLFRTSLSSILDGVQSNETGLYEAGSMGDFLGFNMGTILAIFQMLGMVLCLREWLKMSVRILMACGPRCFKCLLEMPSGPVEGVVLQDLIASIVLAGVNCRGRLGSVCRECNLCMMVRSACLCGRVEMFA